MRHIVFDLGGVLLHWQPWIFLRSYPKLATTDDEARTMAKTIFGAPDWQAFDQGLLDDEAIAQSLSDRLGQPLADMQHLVRSTAPQLKPIDSSVALLRSLAKRRDAGEPLKLWFLSNMPSSYARSLVAKHEWFTCFDGGVFSSDVRMIKPNHDIFEHSAKQFGFAPADAIFIDDLQTNVDAACQLGFQGLFLPDSGQLSKHLLTMLLQK